MDLKKKVRKILDKHGYSSITFKVRDDIIFLDGELDEWASVVDAGKCVASTHLFAHVVNDIKLKGFTPTPMKKPTIEDKSLDGLHVDCVVIGGGVIGCAILRELTKYKIDALLVEKEEDVAMGQSSRNDGCIHVGIDLHKGEEKLKYLKEAKKMIPELCKNIDIEYREDGQSVGFQNGWMRPFATLYLKHKAKVNGLDGIEILGRKEFLKVEPNISENVKFGAHFVHAGAICPYNFTIALGESAIINGAKISLNTVVKEIVGEKGQIKAIITNRGTIYPRLVINAAGVYSDVIANMADDRFFSIHPRKGTDILLDKSVTKSLSRTGITPYVGKKEIARTHSKGGGVIPTIDKNALLGPNAKEVPEREDFTTDIESVNEIFNKQSQLYKSLSRGDIITYFSGCRAATYEEDFVVSKGKWTKNIIHAAGIQSPGLTCAPSIAKQVGIWASEMLNAPVNPDFNPIRKGVKKIKDLPDAERDKLIKENPLYGHIICRCEEISEGEIVDCIHSLIPPSTIDGIKRRVRAGMGRCQGGFCQPNVVSIYARETGKDINDICKKGEGKIIFRDSKENN